MKVTDHQVAMQLCVLFSLNLVERTVSTVFTGARNRGTECKSTLVASISEAFLLPLSKRFI
jgi:hypothetical protein